MGNCATKEKSRHPKPGGGNGAAGAHNGGGGPHHSNEYRPDPTRADRIRNGGGSGDKVCEWKL